ncbi:hypothetical protein BBJ28_00022600 [Nothophytophthora sp. Chile5]|nr:hypothetical protein BBJ28_00022600 [Nothophytophthora sp. Chile5]
MPRKLDWMELDVSQDDGYVFLECLKSNKVVKSQTSSCGLCSYPFPHAMKYQLTACICVACKKAAPYTKCPWRGKILTCTRSGIMCVYETGAHFITVMPPKKESLSIRQKEYCKKLAVQGLKPARIRNSMRRKFGLSSENLPSLRIVQNCVNYYARTKLGNNDSYEEVARSIREKAFTGKGGETDSFTFGWRMDAEQKPIVGIGSDEDPFFVGITTKTLLHRMNSPPESFTFHMDAAFKLNQVGYPVFVVGISDRARRFHLVALFIASQRIEAIYRMALASLRRIHHAVTTSHIRLRFVVGDAEDAQFNAFESIFRGDCVFEYLMCFFHVMVKVQERTKSMPLWKCGLKKDPDLVSEDSTHQVTNTQ